MDSLITAAARALAAGDPLGALKRVALRDDAPALALRGIAMAQLGDLARAKELLRCAAHGFGHKEAVARARCVVALAEIALASRDLGWPAKALDSARETLEKHGDNINAAHAFFINVRRLLLTGRLGEADRMLTQIDVSSLPPALQTVHELLVAGVAVRRIQGNAARAALVRAENFATHARVPALAAEVGSAWLVLNTPAARMIARREERLLLLEDVEELLDSDAIVIDACRGVIRDGRNVISLNSRPVLFELARAMGEAWPEDIGREKLLARAFGARFTDASHRARLRVEIARLRQVIRVAADIHATRQGFVLAPRNRKDVVVLARPVEEEHGAVLALLSDGEAWSSSALALALGTSQRTVQRALDSLAANRKVQPIGRGRARRWITTPVPGFTTTLLLPSSLLTE